MVSKVLTDLDTLFDTRLAVGYLLNEVEAAKAIKNNQYRLRIRDNIGNIPYSVLRPYYRYRSKDIFELALPTYVMGFIKEHVEESIADGMISDEVTTDHIDVFVNAYPYDLNIEEMKLLGKAIESDIPFTNVHMINMDMMQLDCKWIKDNNVNMIVMYDLLYWLELQVLMNNHLDYPIIDVYGFCPAILNSSDYGKKLKLEDFEEFKQNYKSILELTFGPAALFSVQVLDSEIEDVTMEDLANIQKKTKKKQL